MNSLTIIGNITKKPDLRYTQAGTAVCNFTVAVNRRKTQNNKDPGTDYFKVTAWRILAENCGKFLDQGSKVAVVGRVSLDTWENDKKHGASLIVDAESVEFLNSRVAEATEAAPAPVDAQTGFAQVQTDELPF